MKLKDMPAPALVAIALSAAVITLSIALSRVLTDMHVAAPF